MDEELDLKASWIWFPQRRIKADTFIFFRKKFELPGEPVSVDSAWISADSRYQLFVNGTRIQRGPAPYNPREIDADPVDLLPYLRSGKNTISILVCYFGVGDGTYVPGNPGLLFDAQVVCKEGTVAIRTDETWRTRYGQCWSGSYRRWFLRALQEVYDARLYPHGWLESDFDDSSWIPARVLNVPSMRPPVWSSEIQYHEFYVHYPQRREELKVVPRTIPPIREEMVKPVRVCDAGWIDWKIPPEVYFDTFASGAFQERRDEKLLTLFDALKR